MVTQEAVNRWCETVKKRNDATLDSLYWRFSTELEDGKVTKEQLGVLFENWQDGVQPVEILPLVVEEIT